MNNCIYPSCMMGGMGCEDENICMKNEVMYKDAGWVFEATKILNDQNINTKVKRALLREKLKLSEKTIDELCPLIGANY